MKTECGGQTALDIGKQDAWDEVNQILKDAIATFDFNTIMKSNNFNLPPLKSFVKAHGIEGLFATLDDNGSLPIKLIAESNPSLGVIDYIIQKGVVLKMGKKQMNIQANVK